MAIHLSLTISGTLTSTQDAIILASALAADRAHVNNSRSSCNQVNDALTTLARLDLTQPNGLSILPFRVREEALSYTIAACITIGLPHVVSCGAPMSTPSDGAITYRSWRPDGPGLPPTTVVGGGTEALIEIGPILELLKLGRLQDAKNRLDLAATLSDGKTPPFSIAPDLRRELPHLARLMDGRVDDADDRLHRFLKACPAETTISATSGWASSPDGKALTRQLTITVNVMDPPYPADYPAPKSKQSQATDTSD